MCSLLEIQVLSVTLVGPLLGQNEGVLGSLYRAIFKHKHHAIREQNYIDIKQKHKGMSLDLTLELVETGQERAQKTVSVAAVTPLSVTPA